jgi:hypothetical protein
MVGQPEDVFLLYVNAHQIPEVFETPAEAKLAATPYMQKQPALQIKSI